MLTLHEVFALLRARGIDATESEVSALINAGEHIFAGFPRITLTRFEQIATALTA